MPGPVFSISMFSATQRVERPEHRAEIPHPRPAPVDPLFVALVAGHVHPVRAPDVQVAVPVQVAQSSGPSGRAPPSTG